MVKKSSVSQPNENKAAEAPGSGGSVNPENTTQRKQRYAAPAPRPLIVAIGASAGGLEAFEKFFSRMPADSGMGFVLIPHLDASHKSAMTALVQRFTEMKVVEIVDDTLVGANRVHVIPPNAALTIANGRLRIAMPRETARTVDPFLISLAEDQGENAVGIILSGTGSDGTLGIRAIKEHGGLTLAQAAESSRFDSMPHNATASGHVDRVLPVEDMPAQLIHYARHLPELSRDGETASRAGLRRHLTEIFSLLRNGTGHDFSQYKDSTFVRRVERRIQVTQLNSGSAYVGLLRKEPREIEALFRDLLIGVTHFFRDPRAFEALDREVLSALVANKRPEDELRIWVPGCATGEEAYSLAILLHEQLLATGMAPKIQIFATDIDDRALDVARSGRYPATIAREVTPRRLDRYFIRDGNSYRVVKDIRAMCIFSLHSLIKDAPFSRLDLISCRNLLIYLDSELQSRVIPLFHFALRNGGYLFLGPSENVTQHPKLFSRVNPRNRIFKAERTAKIEHPLLDFSLSPTVSRRNSSATKSAGGVDIGETVKRRAARMMEAYAPTYVVIDEHHDILHFFGRSGRYLQPSPGAASFNIFNLLETSLRPDVRKALQESYASGLKIVRDNVLLRVNGGYHAIKIMVEPIALPENSARFYVVAFQDVGMAQTHPSSETGTLSDERNEETIAHLEAEILSLRGRLQATIEELETSNEEMKASNEEFQSVNEELQSANEELETSKEELQSVNEELETVNTELNSKIESLERATTDRKNLLESTEIATIFLDSGLRIKSFTPAIAAIFHLIETDLGRPITDIVMRIAYDRLERDVHKVMRTLSRVEEEVTLPDGAATYMMRILPYRTIDNLIDGVVITFVDITARKHDEEDLARLAAIVGASYDAIIGMTLDGTIVTWNGGAERIYGYPAEEAVGQSLSVVLTGDRQNELAGIIDRIKRRRAPGTVETDRITKDGRRIHVASTISPIRNTGGKVIAISAIERNITERKQAEERQATLVAELNHRVKNTLASVLSIASRSFNHSQTVEAFCEAFEGRVHALALAHDLLAASQWGGADLREIVLTETRPYGEPGNRLSVIGEPIMLRANSAAILGMVLHELTTNAAKHGALSNASGGVEISWRIDRPAGMLSIDWAERDGPPVPAKRQRGFGLELIERSLPHELQGKAVVKFDAAGFRCTLKIPLSRIRTAANETDQKPSAGAAGSTADQRNE